MLKATDYLRNARPRAPVPPRAAYVPAQAPKPPEDARARDRVPPQIPPQIPRAQNASIYKDLMRRHDRVGTRHLGDQRREKL